jgi:nitroreductase
MTSGEEIMPKKEASLDYPIHKFLADRWSPYAFKDSPVSEADLCSLFEAARWSASSYNEQPWSYIVATKQNPEHFQHLLSCLVELNQFWAKEAPVLVLGIVNHKFAHNHEINKAAIHDLGLASGNLVLEATTRGLSAHQMIGILPDKARALFDIPTDSEALVGMAIGYQGDPMTLPDALKERDLMPRQRKSLDQFVFSSKWGTPRSCD